MILFRIGLIALFLFLFFFGFLRLCFSKGYLTRERLKKWNRNTTLAFFTLILVILVMTFISGLDQNL